MTTLKWLEKLIAFDTTSRFSNLELIEFLANSFNDVQIKPILIHDKTQPKANLLATLPSSDGNLFGGIVLSGHTDVVPVDGQTWKTNPFEATLIDGNIYGRGACDMKGYIAVVMSLIPKFKSLKLNFPIHFAFSYDEEIGCLGAPFLIEKLVELNYQPKACIVGEPTSMRPVVGHKGKQSYRCEVHGYAAHSSLTNQGCNAIEHAADFISYLRNIANHYKTHGKKDSYYDVPYTTLATNLIKGGNSYNTIPSLCEFIFEYRNLAVDDADELNEKIVSYVTKELEPNMKAEHKETKVILDTIAKAPGLDTPLSEPIVRAAQSICHDNKTLKVAYATEAGMFQQAKIPTIVCGPGSIEHAHRADEFVPVAQLEKCEGFLLAMMKQSFLV